VVLRARQVLSRIEANSHVAVGISAPEVPPGSGLPASTGTGPTSAALGQDDSGPTARCRAQDPARAGKAA
jgi:hypothetical protein